MGLGRHGGGVAAARWLAAQGAKLTVADTADATTLTESLSKLRGLPIAKLRLGPHEEADFRTEFVVVNPAVNPDHPCLHVARQAGARLTSEIELFLTSCPARVVGVTGSNGKSTTCAMLHAILQSGGRRAWLGGNIGRSLLDELKGMRREDLVVLELSSFQLAHLSDAAPLPHLVVVTNCTPNHLDWHGTLARYSGAKQRLLAMSRAGDAAVLNHHDASLSAWTALSGRRTISPWSLDDIPPLTVSGDHNRQNAACATAAAAALGVGAADIRQALSRFRGLEHRLERFATVAGRRFYNDSKSTSPAATIAALAAIEGPIWLLAGGESKGVSMVRLAAIVVERASGAAVFGAAREAIRSAVAACAARFDVAVVEDLDRALAWSFARSRPGDAIVLSPACSSHDQFRDFEQRGQAFRALVGSLRRAA